MIGLQVEVAVEVKMVDHVLLGIISIDINKKCKNRKNVNVKNRCSLYQPLSIILLTVTPIPVELFLSYVGGVWEGGRRDSPPPLLFKQYGLMNVKTLPSHSIQAYASKAR